MTIKEAVLLSLEDFPKGATTREVYDNIVQKNIHTFNKEAKTPDATVSALMGDMIKKNDIRIKRFKNKNNVFCYYLSKFANNIEHTSTTKLPAKEKDKVFNERSLHPLLCKYLDFQGIMAKTIYHEKSTKVEEHQKWIHPDIVGAHFIERKNKTSNSLFKAIDKSSSLALYSFELKRKIDNDYDLKKCFFQTVSNSSWANYGYLVAFDINENLRDELARLNNSFGIGFILLKANPFESEEWFKAQEKDLDFSTIDKLCEINSDYKKFIDHVEATLTADERRFNFSKTALQNICDNFPKTEYEVREYCKKHAIPLKEDDTIE